MMKKLTMVAAFAAIMCGAAVAQDANKAINTASENGAYNSLFCPPIPAALNDAYFTGYKCVPSKGTPENVERVLANPTQIGMAQYDLYASMAAADPESFKKLTVIRRDIACEGLFMVTKNPRLKNFGDVLGFVRRVPFVMVEGSGPHKTFQFLQQHDPEGLGRVPAENIRFVKDTTEIINTVANGNGGEVGFFVQFAEPNNANIKAIVEKKLTTIGVVSRDFLKIKAGDEQLYDVKPFTFAEGGIFTDATTVTTACTPVALFTGALTNFTGNGVDDQKDMIKVVAEIPPEKLLPQASAIAKLMQQMKSLSSAALEEALAGVDKAKEAWNNANN